MKHNIYIAACASVAEGGGVYHYELDGKTLTLAKHTPMDRPMYLDASTEDMEVILQKPVTGSDVSALVNCPLVNAELGIPGELVMTGGKEACHLCRKDGAFYTTNYSSGSVFSTRGILDVHEGKGPNARRQDMAHTHYIGNSPDGKYLLSVDLGLDSIFTYDADLKVISVAKVPAGYGPRHLAHSEDGKIIFCVNELDSSVSVFDYDDGKLTYRDTTCMYSEHPVAGNTAAAIRVCGDHVYASNRGENDITCMKWDGGKLSVVSRISCGGVSPRDFLIVDGVMLVTNERTNNVTLFTVDGPEMTKLPQELSMPGPLCVIAD